MTTTQVVLLVSALIVVDGVVLVGVRAWVRSIFEELARAFPSRPASHGARRKRFQSLAVNSTNFGGCVAIAVDDEYVHFQPMSLARLFGALDFSVPRSALTDTKASFRGHRKAKLGKWTIAASGWAFE